jgi:hypothetical protein
MLLWRMARLVSPTRERLGTVKGDGLPRMLDTSLSATYYYVRNGDCVRHTEQLIAWVKEVW